MKDGIRVKHNVSWVLYEADGQIAAKGSSHNIDCILHGKLIANLIAGGSPSLIGYGHAGTGTGQDAQDTNLATPCDEARTALDSTTQGTNPDDNEVTFKFELGEGVCTATITEVGLFISSNQNTADMHFYDDDIYVVKGATQVLEVTWVVTYGTSET